MAIDNTPPRLKLIVTIAVITVITLIGIDFVLKSYYAMMTDEAQREKLAPTTARDEQHKAEALALTSGAMPLDKAIAELGKGDRPALIAPQPSDDLGPMTGWSKLPKPAPAAHPHAEAPAPSEADAGAAHAEVAGAVAPLVAGDVQGPRPMPCSPLRRRWPSGRSGSGGGRRRAPPESPTEPTEPP
ncbi:MAG: hypothetical protein KF782_02625 [Labilithrix sp.]|nr:hypothetical protein [Labilithrix sp.]